MKLYYLLPLNSSVINDQNLPCHTTLCSVPQEKLNTCSEKIYKERVCLPHGASGSKERKHRCTRHIVEKIFCWNKRIAETCITLHRLEICCFHISRWGFFIFALQTGNDSSQNFGFRFVSMSQAKWYFSPHNWICIRIISVFNFFLTRN